MSLFLKKILEHNVGLPTPITIEFAYFRQYKPSNKSQPRPANYTSEDGTKRLMFFPIDEFSLLDQEEQTSTEEESDGTRGNDDETVDETADDADETATEGLSSNSSEDAGEPADDADETATEESSGDDSEDVNKLADELAEKL